MRDPSIACRLNLGDTDETALQRSPVSTILVGRRVFHGSGGFRNNSLSGDIIMMDVVM